MSSPGQERAPRAIIVLGMHRSGTSALARCCALLGGDLGPRMIEARPDNESGFWEDPGVVATDDAALLGLRLVWSDFWPIDASAWSSEPLREARGRLVAIARERAAEAEAKGKGGTERPGPPRPWVVKDPRISRLVPLWLAALDEAGVEPCFAISLRDPAEIAASLGRRDALSPAHCELLWLRYVVECEFHTRGRHRVFVPYPALLADWRTTMAGVGTTLGLNWPFAFDAAAPAVESFLRPSLRHHVAGGARGAVPAGDAKHPGERAVVGAPPGGPAGPASSPGSPWVAAAGAALDRIARGEESAGRAELDRVRAEIDAADATALRAAREIEGRMFGYRHEAEVLRAEVEGQSAEYERCSRELAEARGLLEAIFRSRSWQTTAALRALAGRLRALAGGGRG